MPHNATQPNAIRIETLRIDAFSGSELKAYLEVHPTALDFMRTVRWRGFLNGLAELIHAIRTYFDVFHCQGHSQNRPRRYSEILY